MNDEDLRIIIKAMINTDPYDNVCVGFQTTFDNLKESRKKLENKVLAHLGKKLK